MTPRHDPPERPDAREYDDADTDEAYATNPVMTLDDLPFTPRAVQQLGSQAPALFAELLRRGARTGSIRASVSDLARSLNVHRNTVTRAATVLVRAGFATRVYNAGAHRAQDWHVYMRPRRGAA